jgi:hypothetical protein
VKTVYADWIGTPMPQNFTPFLKTFARGTRSDDALGTPRKNAAAAVSLVSDHSGVIAAVRHRLQLTTRKWSAGQSGARRIRITSCV